MSTRSYVGIERADKPGTYKMQYAHHDGYFAHTGIACAALIGQPDAINAIVGTGGISQLNAYPQDTTYLDESTPPRETTIEGLSDIFRDGLFIEYVYLFSADASECMATEVPYEPDGSRAFEQQEEVRREW